jgi:membrane protein implicated in regulation of membrane protease activity
MLTDEETRFMEYWEANRLRKRRGFRQLAVGLPLAVTIMAALFINFFSGWYKRADMMIRSQSQSSQASLVLVIVIAALLIVVFTTVFSIRHKWDQHEQRYRELLEKKGRT